MSMFDRSKLKPKPLEVTVEAPEITAKVRPVGKHPALGAPYGEKSEAGLRRSAFNPVLPWSVGVHVVREALVAHWLSDLGCRHEDGGNNQASCFCGWTGDRVANVGLAVESWADHVREVLSDG